MMSTKAYTDLAQEHLDESKRCTVSLIAEREVATAGVYAQLAVVAALDALRTELATAAALGAAQVLAHLTPA